MKQEIDWPPAEAIKAVLFDFGGVLAEEGFREGLFAIARRQGLDPQEVYRIGAEAVYDSGYVLGKGSEADFWAMMRKRTGIRGEDAELTGAVLPCFVVRPRLLEAVQQLRRQGFIVAILSDQTDWLEQLDQRDHFYWGFDAVFNSYRLGKGKQDPSLFADVTARLGVAPCAALFIDDSPGHVARARTQGLQAVVFESEEQFLAELPRLLRETW